MACCAVQNSIRLLMPQGSGCKVLSVPQGSGNELQSQSVGTWTKTYRSGGDSAQQALASAQAAQSTIAAIAQQYLGTTGLLYRGRECCYGYVPACCDGL